MTLVAGLSVGGMPAFIGDLLVSWRVPSAVDLPTQRRKRVHRSLGGAHAAGLAQKIVVVRPYLMLAWAGECADVNRMIRDLDNGLPLDSSELHDPDAILKVLDTCGANSELVALLMFNDAIYPICVRTRGFELDNKRIYLLGSGASEFFDYLQTHPDILPNQERADGLVAQAIMLRFAARYMALQLATGTGLRDSWGGGFEVGYPDQNGFKKVDNLMFRAWTIDEKGAYHNSGRSFFLRYYGTNLHLSWFNPGEKTYVIRSPLQKRSHIPHYEEVHPQWTLDLFVLKQTHSLIEFARFHPVERPVIDRIQLRKGGVVGWTMDKDYVEQCVKMAINSANKSNHFDMIRY
jgi:hypothetical protein